MADLLKDVLRVCDTAANLPTVIAKEKMLAFATDTHRLYFKAPGGTGYWYADDACARASITMADAGTIGLGAGKVTLAFTDSSPDDLTLTGGVFASYMAVNNGDNYALILGNIDEPLTTEIGQSVSIVFQLMHTSDSGSSYSLVSAGRITVGKDSDFFNASGDADNDSNMQFKTMLDGTLTERMRLTSAGYLGLGIAAPKTQFHLYGGASGATIVGVSGLAVESNGATGIRVFTPNNMAGSIQFFDDAFYGGEYLTIQYLHSTDTFSILTPSYGILSSVGGVTTMGGSLIADLTTSYAIKFANGGTQALYFAGGADEDFARIHYAYNATPASEYLAFYLAAAEKLRIIGNGNIAIGHTDNYAASIGISRAANNLGVFQVYQFSDDVNDMGKLMFRRAYNDSIGTVTDTPTGTYLGGIEWYGASSGSKLGAQILCVQNGAAGTTVPTNLVFYTSTDSVGPTERVRMATAGINVVGEVQCDTLRIDTGLTTGLTADQHVGFACTAQLIISANGVNYKVPCAAA